MQPDEAIVYDVVTELLTKRQLSDDSFGKAKQILGEQQVVDLVAVTGFYVMVSAVVIAGRIANRLDLRGPKQPTTHDEDRAHFACGLGQYQARPELPEPVIGAAPLPIVSLHLT